MRHFGSVLLVHWWHPLRSHSSWRGALYSAGRSMQGLICVAIQKNLVYARSPLANFTIDHRGFSSQAVSVFLRCIQTSRPALRRIRFPGQLRLAVYFYNPVWPVFSMISPRLHNLWTLGQRSLGTQMGWKQSPTRTYHRSAVRDAKARRRVVKVDEQRIISTRRSASIGRASTVKGSYEEMSYPSPIAGMLSNERGTMNKPLMDPRYLSRPLARKTCHTHLVVEPVMLLPPISGKPPCPLLVVSIIAWPLSTSTPSDHGFVVYFPTTM
ncbi:hypothetical protein PTI98_010562 [Pleurotus ostreatus]|nr:hypothetical protein PTI98_010562 [Pleurotus ostreatus]